MAYFYFDFRDTNKQGFAYTFAYTYSFPFSCNFRPARVVVGDILSELYPAHDQGNNQPSDISLVECLKNMITLSDPGRIYLIVDALDESPNTSGIPSRREAVLHLLKELVDLSLPNLHLCATS